MLLLLLFFASLAREEKKLTPSPRTQITEIKGEGMIAGYTTTVLPDPSTPAPTPSLKYSTCKSSLVDFSMQIFKFQRRSCKLSFLFPPRRQSAPESLLAGYCKSLVLNHFCSVTIPFYPNPSPKYLQVTCKKI